MKLENLQENGDKVSIMERLILRKVTQIQKDKKLHVDFSYVDLCNVLHLCIKMGINMGKARSKTKQKTGKKAKRQKKSDEIELWQDKRSHVV